MNSLSIFHIYRFITHSLRTGVLLLLVILSGVYAFSQTNSPLGIKRCIVKTINFEQGLMNNGTCNIITDVYGLTWISTQTGMQRYNGYLLEQVTPIINKDTLHISSRVYFFGRENGNILISFKNQVLQYSPYTNSFTSLIRAEPTPNLYYSIIPVKETSEGIWCMQEKKGLVIYNLQGQLVRVIPNTYHTFDDNVSYLQNMMDRTAVVSNSHLIFVCTVKSQILQIDTLLHQQRVLPINIDGILHIACDEHRVYILSATTLSCLNIHSGLIVKQIPLKSLANESVGYSALELAGEDQLLVSVNGHLFELDTTFATRKEFTTLEKKPLLAEGGIHTIYTDKFKRIWMLTNDDVKRIKNVELPFEHLLYANEKNNFTRCLYFDEKINRLLAGCYNGGIQLYDTLGNQIWDKHLMTSNVKDILVIDKIADDNYLVITSGKGWYSLKLSTRQLLPFPIPAPLRVRFHPENNSFSNNCQRINDSTLQVTNNENAYRCVFRSGQLVRADSLLPITLQEIYHMDASLYTNDGTIWAGAISGMVYRMAKDGKLQILQSLDNCPIRSIAEDSLHNIWVGTEKGMNIFSSDGRRLKVLTRGSGLLNDCIYALLPIDHTASVFASNNLGLSFISLSGKIRNYTKELGLQENEFNTNACVKTVSGRFYFGGVNGITAFYPEALSAVKDTPVLNITRLIVNDSSYNSYAGPWQASNLSLAYDQKRIQFDIAAMGLLNTNEYAYSYRLIGFDTNWRTTHQPTGINYTLQPGNYTFEIKCSPVLSSNSVFTKTITIDIANPWWETWKFNIIAFVLLVSLIALIFWQYNQRRYARKIRMLQVQSEIQDERERISRELHDNIGTQLSYISSNVDWLLEAPVSFSREEETRRLSVLNDTAKSLVSDLRQTIWAIKKEFILLDELADKLKLFLQSQCLMQPQLEMTISENIQDNISLSPTDALNIFRICQEAIVNCLKHAQAKQIALNIQSHSARSFSFTIIDNGKGYPLHMKYPEHYGLENMVHRAKELGARLDIYSEPGKGTTVSLTKL